MKENNNINIILITQNFPPETVGGAIHNFEIAKYLSRLGCNVDVITSFPCYPYGEFTQQNRLFTEEVMDGMHVKRIWTYQPQSSNPSIAKRLLQYCIFPFHAFFQISAAKKYDVIITSQPPEFTLLVGYLLKKFTGKPWLLDVRDTWLENAASLGFISKNGFFYKFFNKLREISLPLSDLFTYTSVTIKDEFMEKYAIQSKHFFNPNGIDPIEYHIGNGGNGNIIYIGNVGFAYNLKSVIKSLQYVHDKNLCLLIRGGGDKKPELTQLIERLQLQDRARFVDKLPRKQLLDLIANSRLGICPLNEEDTLRSVIPTKVLEYMGCGIPFVGTGCGEIERLAEESGAGIIVQDNPEEIAEAINLLHENERLRSKMAISGRKYVEEYYNKPKIISELFQHICDLVSSKKSM